MPSGIAVHLDPWELALAAKVGVARTAYAMANGLHDAHGLRGGVTGWAIGVAGAVAELTVAKAVDRYWDGYVGPTEPHRPDVGPLEVRYTPVPGGHLMVYRHESGPFVLVTGDPPALTIHGYINAADAKRAEWWTVNRGPGSGCYWVPQDALRPIEELSRA